MLLFQQLIEHFTWNLLIIVGTDLVTRSLAFLRRARAANVPGPWQYDPRAGLISESAIELPNQVCRAATPFRTLLGRLRTGLSLPQNRALRAEGRHHTDVQAPKDGVWSENIRFLLAWPARHAPYGFSTRRMGVTAAGTSADGRSEKTVDSREHQEYGWLDETTDGARRQGYPR